MELFSVGPRQFKQSIDRAAIRAAVAKSVESGQVRRLMAELGIGMDAAAEAALVSSFGMDADLVAPLTTAGIGQPIQFYQHWLPGLVEVITAARKIDNLVGVSTQGQWHQEEIVQQIIEYTGNALPYGDFNNTAQASWNTNYERRSLVRFEEGMTVGRLEEARAGEARINSGDSKRTAAAVALEIQRNRIGFSGYNNGANRTYGFLNDPNLPAYVNVPNGAGGTSPWSAKSFNEIVSDILGALVALRVQSQERVDPTKDPITLAVATAAVDRLATVSQYGVSVWDWLAKSYPNVRVESAPELNAANGGANVFYMFAETVRDSGSDDQRTFVQVVPSKFMTLGVEQRAKSYTEAYTNATAGVFLKRPYAVVRRSGI